MYFDVIKYEAGRGKSCCWPASSVGFDSLFVYFLSQMNRNGDYAVCLLEALGDIMRHFKGDMRNPKIRKCLGDNFKAEKRVSYWTVDTGSSSSSQDPVLFQVQYNTTGKHDNMWEVEIPKHVVQECFAKKSWGPALASMWSFLGELLPNAGKQGTITVHESGSVVEEHWHYENMEAGPAGQERVGFSTTDDQTVILRFHPSKLAAMAAEYSSGNVTMDHVMLSVMRLLVSRPLGCSGLRLTDDSYVDTDRWPVCFKIYMKLPDNSKPSIDAMDKVWQLVPGHVREVNDAGKHGKDDESAATGSYTTGWLLKLWLLIFTVCAPTRGSGFMDPTAERMRMMIAALVFGQGLFKCIRGCEKDEIRHHTNKPNQETFFHADNRRPNDALEEVTYEPGPFEEVADWDGITHVTMFIGEPPSPDTPRYASMWKLFQRIMGAPELRCFACHALTPEMFVDNGGDGTGWVCYVLANAKNAWL